MVSVKKILCAVDLSEVSSQVAEYAAQQAKWAGASVLVMYVAPALNQYSDTEMPLAIIKNFISERIENAEKVMPGLLQEHFAGVDVSSRIVAGYPPDSILEAAKEDHVDMIVLGTHGRRGVNAVVFGSVAEKVIKQAAVPVLVVRPK